MRSSAQNRVRLVYILLLFLLSQSQSVSQKRLKPVQDGLLRSVLKINTVDGPNEIAYTSTGFLIQKEGRFFLITNKHVIGEYYLESGICRYFDDLHIHYYSRAGEEEYASKFKISLKDNNLIHEHPENWVDVVAIEVTDKRYLFESNTVSLSDTYLRNGRQIDENYELGPGDEFLVLGYPKGYGNLNNSLPLVKPATLTNTPNVEMAISITEYNQCLNDTTTNIYNGDLLLFDGLIMHGNSGGPIVMRREFFAPDGPSPSLYGVSRHNLVVGIVSRRVIFGLTIAYASDYILELLDLATSE